MTPLDDLVFHHVGIACERIENEIPQYELIGFRREGEIFEDSRQVIRGLFMKAGSMQIELIEPLRPESPVCTFLRGASRCTTKLFSRTICGPPCGR